MKTRSLKYIRIFTAIAVFIAVCALSVSADTFNGSITEVVISNDKESIEISAEISKEFVNANKDCEIFVFRLAPYMNSNNLNELTPVKTLELREKLDFKLDFKRADIYSSYVLAAINNGNYAPISAPHYIENPEIFAENTAPYPEKSTKKGLYSQIGSDAEDLGVAHTVISIDINEFMSMTFKEDTDSYIKNGQTFYFYTDMLKKLDHRVKVYTEAGMNVYFNIVLGNDNGSGLSSVFPFTGSGKASYYAIDTDTFSSVRYYTAFCEFLAERYSDSDTSNGFVPAYILGYEADTYTWNYADEISPDEYIEKYNNAFRILYTAVKSVYSEGKVFVSVSNVFNQTSEDTAHSIGYKLFLEKLAANFKLGGDIDWALSVNPYESDPTIGKFWEDEKAINSMSTEYITVKNLNVLSEYMSFEKMRYKQNVRDIIIGEFGINGNYDDARDNDKQAAAYALAYAIVDNNPDIDAFIYYRHVDYFAEPVKLGLWSSISSSPLTPVNKKAIYYVFKNVDTSDYKNGLAMARAFCSEDVFNSYLSDYSPSPKHNFEQALPIEKSDIPTTFSENILFDLSLGSLCEFYPSNNCSYIELRQRNSDSPETEMYAKMAPVSGVTYMGVSRSIGKDIKLDGDYLTVKFTPVAPANEAMTVMLRLEGKSGHTDRIFEGIVELQANTESELTFKISDYVKKTGGNIEMLKLWFKPSSGVLKDGEYGLWLNSIATYSSTGLSMFLTVLLIFFGILAFAAVIIVIAYIVRNRELRHNFKGFIGKTKSKFIKFLRKKKIISQRKKKPKGARRTQSKNPSAPSGEHKTSNGLPRDIPGGRPRVMTGVNRQAASGTARNPQSNLQTKKSQSSSNQQNKPNNGEKI